MAAASNFGRVIGSSSIQTPMALYTAFAMVGAHHARRLQSGRLGVYVAYLLGLVLVVLTAAKLGILG